MRIFVLAPSIKNNLNSCNEGYLLAVLPSAIFPKYGLFTVNYFIFSNIYSDATNCLLTPEIKS